MVVSPIRYLRRRHNEGLRFGNQRLSIAVAAPVLAQGDITLSEAYPELAKEEIDAIGSYAGEDGENAMYARAYCVSVGEAERRTQIQNRSAIGLRTDPGPRPDPVALHEFRERTLRSQLDLCLERSGEEQ